LVARVELNAVPMSSKRQIKNLEAERSETLSEIRDERDAFESMLQRARIAKMTPANEFLADVFARFEKIEQAAQTAQNIDEISQAGYDADTQGQLRAYLCPLDEIEDEGTSCLDAMEEWNVPLPVMGKLRGSLLPKIANANANQSMARSALRSIYEEHDSWARYTTSYQSEMRSIARILSGAIIGFIALALICFHFPKAVLAGIILAGAAGSCTSVISKMPLLSVGLSGELESYERRVLTRLSVGIVASLIGSGFLAWGIITFTIGAKTFPEMVNECTVGSGTCTALNTLVLLTVPMLFGFSERALTSFEGQFEGQLFGKRD